MKKNYYIKLFFKSFLITIGVLIGIIVVTILIVYVLGNAASEYSTEVFETSNENYNIKIIKDGEKVATDVFSYENKKENKKIGCGTLMLVGYDSDKGYLYGKSEFGKKRMYSYTSNKIAGSYRIETGIYEDEKKLIENDVYTEKIEAEGHIYITDEKTEENIAIKREEKSNRAIEFLKNSVRDILF